MLNCYNTRMPMKVSLGLPVTIKDESSGRNNRREIVALILDLVRITSI